MTVLVLPNLLETGLGDQLLTEMCSGSEAGSHLKLTDFVYHSTPDLRIIQRKKEG